MSQERTIKVINGWTMLVVDIVLLLGGLALLIYSFTVAPEGGSPNWLFFTIGAVAFALSIVGMNGFFTLQPNEARVLILFGAYRGTVRESGFHWADPFYSNGSRQNPGGSRTANAAVPAKKSGNAVPPGSKRFKISLRARTLNGEKLKVNDKRGNPIEIGAVVVWRVNDTAQATFDVDNYEDYVALQSESALRHLATEYAYDHIEEVKDGESSIETTLRANVDEVSQALRVELQERFSKAGVAVEEARLTHLAYSPEIAQAMLRRQQAEAVIAARRKIVQGAVTMVDMALRELSEKQVVVLDDERKAAMVSNLMVVLCGESEVHPVVNTGTLYA